MLRPAASTTVRQTPLTATLSPGVNPEARSAPTVTRSPPGVRATSTIRPSDSMIPVNISFDPHVVTNRSRSQLRERRDGAIGEGRPLDAAGTDGHRRDEQLHPVDEAR